MGSLFSAISGKFSSTLITGTFLPVLLFLTLYVLVIEPLVPGLFPIPPGFQSLDTQWKALLITFGVFLLTGLLAVVNHVLLRVYSGYGWMSFGPGKWLASLHNNRRARLATLRDRMWNLGSDAASPDALDQALTGPLTAVSRTLSNEYPIEGNVLPTRLGNAIANAESYFKARYGMDHAVGWWRLMGVLDSGFAGALDDAKASLDFALHTSFLSLLFVVWLLAAAYSPAVWTGGRGAAFVWRIAAFALASRLAYLAAVDRARALGALEKSAIDLYRLKLLKQMGVEYEFTSLPDERAVWSQLETSVSFPGQADGPSYRRPVPPAAPPIGATSAGKTLPVSRALRSFHSARYPRAEVELTIRNEAAAASRKVDIMDSIPTGWAFVSGSASASAGTLTLKGTEPLRATLSSIAARSSVTVTYQIQCWKAANA